jgi:hypothetical protein
MTVAINRANPDPTYGSVGIGVNLSYFFNTTDVTQRDVNDRVVVDFDFLRSATSLARVDAFMQDEVDDYVSQQFSIAPNNGPFSLEFPFSTFTPRGGGLAQIDLHHIHTMYLSIQPNFINPIDPVNFSSAVERIRFTNGVPEPGPFALVGWPIISAFAGRHEKGGVAVKVQLKSVSTAIILIFARVSHTVTLL